MKVAISSDGTTWGAAVSPRFGRCPFFLLVDTGTRTLSAIPNEQKRNAAQGAGIQAAEAVVQAGAEAVLTGHCGPKAFRVLRAAGVPVYLGVAGTISLAVDALVAGALQPAADADVEGHWS